MDTFGKTPFSSAFFKEHFLIQFSMKSVCKDPVYNSIGSGNGLLLNQQQAIAFPNGGHSYSLTLLLD